MRSLLSQCAWTPSQYRSVQSRSWRVGVSARGHAADQVHESLGALDPGGQQIRRQDVDSQDARVSLGTRDALILGVEGGVVDHCVDATEGVHLIRHTARLISAGKITHHDGGGVGSEITEAGGPRVVASVQEDFVTEIEELSRGAGAEPRGGARYEHARHKPPRSWPYPAYAE